MRQEEGKTKANAPVNTKILQLQTAVNQSAALPKDNFAKSQNVNNPAPNVSALQKATQQCAPLPKNRVVQFDAAAESSKKS